MENRHLEILHGSSNKRTRVSVSRRIAGVWISREYVATRASINRVRSKYFSVTTSRYFTSISAADNIVSVFVSVPVGN
jgi:hypothetical protein